MSVSIRSNAEQKTFQEELRNYTQQDLNYSKDALRYEESTQDCNILFGLMQHKPNMSQELKDNLSSLIADKKCSEALEEYRTHTSQPIAVFKATNMSWIIVIILSLMCMIILLL